MKNKNEKPKSPPIEDVSGITGHLALLPGSIRAWLLAYVAIYIAYDTNQYPAFGRAKVIEWDWMWPILARNWLATLFICGFWDWFLYFSPLKVNLLVNLQ